MSRVWKLIQVKGYRKKLYFSIRGLQNEMDI